MKKNSNKIKLGLKIVDQIQNVRSKNNKNWMDLVRLSLMLDHKRTSRILYHINNQDNKISNLAKKIYNLSKKEIKK